MFFEDKRQIGIFVLANIAAICANGQNYADRGNLPTGIAIEDEEDDDLLHTDHYIWSQDQDDDSKVWRWNVEEYPHPQNNPRYCNRIAVSNVCDPDGILIRDEANRLDVIIRNIFNNTPCICDKCGPNDGGIQVGIALLRNTFQPYIEHQYKVIRSFTQNLRSKWHLGNCGNDILIVLATDDRHSYTDVGSAAAKFISKDDALEIFKRNKSYFSRGEYYEGLQEMLKAFQNATKGLPKHQDHSEMGMALISGIIVIIVIVVGILIIVAVILYRRRMYKKNPRCQRGGTRTSSWRPKNIKLLLSSFVSSPDAYQPCKTQEGKQEHSDNHISTEGHNQNDDDEILNLDLAEPEPKTVDADVETTEANLQVNDPPFHSEEHNEIEGENQVPQVLEENFPNSASENQQDVVAEVKLPVEDGDPTFQTSTPKLHQEDVVDDATLPIQDKGPTFQTFTPKWHQDDVVAEAELPIEDNRPTLQTFASKLHHEDVIAAVREDNGPTFQTFTPKSKELHQTDL